MMFGIFVPAPKNLTNEVQGRQLLSVRTSAIPERFAWGFLKTNEAKIEFPRVTALHKQEITQDIGGLLSQTTTNVFK